MRGTVKRLLREGLTRLDALPALAAHYDINDITSLRNDAGAIPANGEGIKLVSDKSGNSAVNCLVLNGVAGNYGSSPDSAALDIIGDIGIFARIAANDYTPGGEIVLGSKWVTTGNQRSYALAIASTGNVRLYWSVDGAAASFAVSTATLPLTDLMGGWVYATMDVNDGAGNRVIKFYYAADTGSNAEPTWIQLGATVTTAGTTSIFASTSVVQVGCSDAGTSGLWGGLVHRFAIRNGFDGAGTIVFDPIFSTFTKLAASGTESSSNAATVTINTTGATGARISGARDLYQGTVANQPILTIAATGNFLTFDGSNDYLKAGAFALAQPETVYFVGSQVTWTTADGIYDGGALLGMSLRQTGLTPEVVISAGNGVGPVSPAVATNCIITGVFNAASSSIRLNRATAATGNASTNNANGFIIGARGDLSNPANITFSESAIYSVAHDLGLQDRVIRLLGRHNAVTV